MISNILILQVQSIVTLKCKEMSINSHILMPGTWSQDSPS